MNISCKIKFTSPFTVVVEDSLNGRFDVVCRPELDDYYLDDEEERRIVWPDGELQLIFINCTKENPMGELDTVHVGGCRYKNYSLWADDIIWEGSDWLDFLVKNFENSSKIY
jgi:hypothetical protein